MTWVGDRRRYGDVRNGEKHSSNEFTAKMKTISLVCVWTSVAVTKEVNEKMHDFTVVNR